MHPGWFAPSTFPQNTTKRLIDDLVVQPRKGPETVVKTFLWPSKAMAVRNISSHVPTSHLREFVARTLRMSKSVTYSLQFRLFRAPLGQVIFFAEKFPIGCGTTYNASWMLRTLYIATEFPKPPIYNFVVQPRNGPETIVKDVLMPVQSHGSPKYTAKQRKE